MKSSILRTFPLLMVFAAFAFGGNTRDMQWRKSSETLWQEARQQGRPVLAEFRADWCAPCKRMDREVWTNKQVIAAASKFVQASVDASHVALGLFGPYDGHQIRGLPTLMIADPWEEILLFVEGYLPAAELIPLLRDIPADYTAVRTFREMLIRNRNNVRALQAMGFFYQRGNAFGIANRYYREALASTDPRHDREVREPLILGVAMNELRRADWEAARKQLEQFWAEQDPRRGKARGGTRFPVPQLECGGGRRQVDRGSEIAPALAVVAERLKNSGAQPRDIAVRHLPI
jgi:thiol-disulfide isomerase/thioredoxin